MSSLESYTLVYWNISAARHGTPSKTPNITTEKAISSIHEATNFLGPHRRVKGKLETLLDQIVVGSPRKKGKSIPAQVIQLRRAAT